MNFYSSFLWTTGNARTVCRVQKVNKFAMCAVDELARDHVDEGKE